MDRHKEEQDRRYADYGEEDRTEVRTLSGINFILGIWLIVSPFVLSYASGVPRWNQVVLGIIVLVLAAIRELAPSQTWSSFLNGLAGIWAIIAPFALSYNHSAAYWNSVIVGIVIAVLAFWNSSIHITGTRHHGAHA